MYNHLMDIRQDYKDGKINSRQFCEAIKPHLESVYLKKDIEKVLIFDQLAEGLIDMFTSEPAWIDQNKGYLWWDSDNNHYAYEALMTGIFGNEIWKFKNRLYEG